MSKEIAKQVQDVGSSTPITKETLRAYICPLATDQELVMFMELCRHRRLNPFLKEAYLIKYSERQPASMVVGKDVFLSRANEIGDYLGFKAGVILLNGQEVVKTSGLIPPDHKLIGGWAIVLRQDREPLEIEVNLSEYIGKKSDGTPNSNWGESGKPATMIRKVALVQAHREAFPDQFSGMYDEAELPAMQQTVPEPAAPPPVLRKEPESAMGCESCGAVISPSVHGFSLKKFNKPLCMDCQKNANA